MSTKEYVNEILSDVSCKPYEFRVFEETGGLITMEAVLYRQDTDTGIWGWGHGTEYIVPENASEAFIVKRALKACLDYAEHECRESFSYKGKRVFGPHISLEKLMESV